MKNKIRFIFYCLLIISVSVFQASGADILWPEGPDLSAESAILIDYDTGLVLYEKNADISVPPASLTKLVTLHILYSYIESGMLTMDTRVEIPREAWYTSMPPGSSIMFLGPGQHCTIRDLMMGLAVSSGNDAAVAAAYIISGDTDTFAELMNSEVRSLGFSSMEFFEPSGISERNSITAREFANFCRTYIKLHPRSLKEIHNKKEFTYPRKENLIAENGQPPITQHNRNTLIGSYPGADGLKTGYIDESGYNLAVTAVRSGTRLIGVLLGIQAESSAQGSSLRSEEGRKLLDFGFSNFITLEPDDLEYPEPKIWKGEKDLLSINPMKKVIITLPRNYQEDLHTNISIQPFIEAPVYKGEKIGELQIFIGSSLYESFTLSASETIEEGGFFKRVMDSMGLFFARRREN